MKLFCVIIVFFLTFSCSSIKKHLSSKLMPPKEKHHEFFITPLATEVINRWEDEQIIASGKNNPQKSKEQLKELHMNLIALLVEEGDK